MPDNSFLVRRAAPADIDSMLAIWQETAEMLSSADRRFRVATDGADHWREALSGWLNHEDMAVFVADRKGKAIGYLVGSIQANPGFEPEQIGLVNELAVDSHGKAGGIGRDLLDAFKAWLRERNITAVEARVPVAHPIAQAFWRAIGAVTLFEHMRLKI